MGHHFQQPFVWTVLGQTPNWWDPHPTRQAMPIFQKMSLSEWGCQQRAGLTRDGGGSFFFFCEVYHCLYIYIVCATCASFLKNDDDDDDDDEDEDEDEDDDDGDDDGNQCARASRMNPFNAPPRVHPNCGQRQQIFMVNSLIRLMKAQTCNYLGQLEENGDDQAQLICRISTKNNRDSDSIATVTILVQAV